MTTGETVILLGALLGSGGLATLIGTVFLLRYRQQESKATARRTLADAEHTNAAADAVMATVYGGMIDELRKEIERKVDDLERQVAEAAGREWVCLENQETLRRALISAGVPVPELRDVFGGAHRTGDHPRRRRTDHIDPDTEE